MEEGQDNQDFESLSKTPYFVDNTDSIAYSFEGRNHKAITRPCKWGKTLFLQSFELFCGHQLDKEGNIIENSNTEETPFGVFTHLKVVTEDKLRIDDILFILQSQELKNSTGTQFGYFKSADYPEFNGRAYDKENQKKLLEKKQKAVQRCFPPEVYSSFSQESLDQQKLILQELISQIKQKNIQAYYQLLKEFGHTCRHYQRYPIISVRFPTKFKKMKNSKEAEKELIVALNQAIMELYKKNQYILELMKKKENNYYEFEITKFQGFMLGKNDLTHQSDSLKYLTFVLHQHYKVQCIVLIDDYDSILLSAGINGCLEEIHDIILSILLKAFKHNENVTQSFVVGRTRVEQIFSELYHHWKCSLLENRYGKFFGFSEGQVRQLLEKCNLNMPTDNQIEFSTLKMMYNSYRIGKESFFNPFSIYKCLSMSVQNKHPTYDLFYKESGSIHILADIFSRTKYFENRIEDFLNKELVLTPYKELDYRSLKSEISNEYAYSFAFHLGYLTLSETLKEKSLNEIIYPENRLKIPNKEIRDLMITILLPMYYQIKWNIVSLSFQEIQNLHDGIYKIEDFENKVKSTFLNGLAIEQSRTESDFSAIFYQLNKIVELKDTSLNEQPAVQGKKSDSIFYSKNKSSPIVVLHEYSVVKHGKYQQSLNEALWKIVTKGCIGNTLPENTKLPNTTHVLIRALVFFKNLQINKWEIKAEQFMLSFEEVRQLIATCTAYDDLAKASPKSPKNKIRKEFLSKNNSSSISQLIRSHSLHNPTKIDFSSSAQIKVIRPPLMAECAIPQASFYRIDSLHHSPKLAQFPPSPQKMARLVLSDFQRAEKRRLQVRVLWIYMLFLCKLFFIIRQSRFSRWLFLEGLFHSSRKLFENYYDLFLINHAFYDFITHLENLGLDLQ